MKKLLVASAVAALFAVSPAIAADYNTNESSTYGTQGANPAIQKPNSADPSAGTGASTGASSGEAGSMDVPASSEPYSSAQPEGNNEETQPTKPLQKKPSSTGEQ